MGWQFSISLWDIWISTALNTSITECSRFLYLILSGIGVISILFLQSYCSTDFVAASRIMTLGCKYAIVSINWAFSSWSFLIIMFFILMTSSRKSRKFQTKSFRSFHISSAKFQLILASLFVVSSDVLQRVGYSRS